MLLDHRGVVAGGTCLVTKVQVCTLTPSKPQIRHVTLFTPLLVIRYCSFVYSCLAKMSIYVTISFGMEHSPHYYYFTVIFPIPGPCQLCYIHMYVHVTFGIDTLSMEYSIYYPIMLQG